MFNAYLAEKYKPTSKGFEPYINPDSTLLILNYGNSKAAYEKGFYYGNERNNFWKILATSFSMATPNFIDEKKMLLKSTKIALCNIILDCKVNPNKDRWDDWWNEAVTGCPQDAVYIYDIADIMSLVSHYPIKKIIANGKEAYKLFIDNFPELAAMCIWLPSTAPLNIKLMDNDATRIASGLYRLIFLRLKSTFWFFCFFDNFFKFYIYGAILSHVVCYNI